MPTQSTRKPTRRSTFSEIHLLPALQLFGLPRHRFPLRTGFRALGRTRLSRLTIYPANFQAQSFRLVVLDLKEGSLTLQHAPPSGLMYQTIASWRYLRGR